MALRMTGLNSGLDTESIVGALMEAHKAKKTKVDNKKTTLEWKQEIWKDLNKKLYSFYTNFAGKLRFQTNYMTKKVSSSNSAKVTGTATTKAVNGTYTVKVNKMAAAQNVTSAKLTEDKNGNAVTGKTKLTDLGIDADTQIHITTNKKDITLTVDENTTVNDFVTSLQNAGLTASFDEKQGRFFIGTTASGKDQTFQITTSTMKDDGNVKAKLDELRELIGGGTLDDYNDLSAANHKTITAALDALKNSIAKDGYTDKAVEAATKAIEDMLDANVKAASTEKYTNELTDKYNNDYGITRDGDGNVTGIGQGMSPEDLEELQKELGSKYMDVNSVEAMEKIADAVAAAKAKAEANGETFDAAAQAEVEEATKQEILKKNTEAVDSLIKKKVTADLKTDEYKDKIAKDVSDAQNARVVGGVNVIQNAVSEYADALANATDADYEQGAEVGNAVLNSLGLDTITGKAVKEEDGIGAGADGRGMVVVAAEDSEVVVNGATLTSSSTVLEVNGLTLNLTGVTDDEVTITITDDTQGVYDMIKEFVNQYNSILNEMNTYYNASSARGYDPLTSEQKDEMSDTEIEQWEKKIKDSLLRRDSTLDGLLTAFRSMTSTTVKASNGRTYSLAMLGITTGRDYKENGLLHIKGDEDDTDYADDDNVLMNLLNEDPSVVTEVLAGITTQLYNTLTKKMQSSSLSSALTFYNDKEMNKQLSQYNKDIAKWETKLKDMEDRYYKQFAAMEKALANMQSQQSALAGFFGY